MADWTRDTLWRQGHLLTNEAIRALDLKNEERPDDIIVIVASHDCDVVQSPEIEPMVEVLVGRKINVTDGNHTHAKAPRTLHIDFDGNTALVGEFVATKKYSIPKQKLSDFNPEINSSLSPENRNTFQRWLAVRYRRSAFPDEFQHRLVSEANLADKINKAVKPHGNYISAVFFDVDEGEDVARVESDDVYILDIILLYSTESDFDRAEDAARTASATIEAAFKKQLLIPETGKWRLIELRHVDVVSEDALSYKVFKNLKQWRLDHLSLRADPQQPLVVE